MTTSQYPALKDSFNIETTNSTEISQKHRRTVFGSKRGIFNTGNNTNILSMRHDDQNEPVSRDRRQSVLDQSQLSSIANVRKRNSFGVKSLEPATESIVCYNTRRKRKTKKKNKYSAKGLSSKSFAEMPMGDENTKAARSEQKKIERNSYPGAFTSPKKLQRIRLRSRKKREKIKQRNSVRVSRNLYVRGREVEIEQEDVEKKLSPSMLGQFLSMRGRRKTTRLDMATTESMIFSPTEPSVQFTAITRELSSISNLTAASIKPPTGRRDLLWKREKIKQRNMENFSLHVSESQTLRKSKEGWMDDDSKESVFQHEASNSNSLICSSMQCSSTFDVEKFSLTPVEEQTSPSKESKGEYDSNHKIQDKESSHNASTDTLSLSKKELESLIKRITQLEHVVIAQSAEISELKHTCRVLTETNIAL